MANIIDPALVGISPAVAQRIIDSGQVSDPQRLAALQQIASQSTWNNNVAPQAAPIPPNPADPTLGFTPKPVSLPLGKKAHLPDDQVRHIPNNDVPTVDANQQIESDAAAAQAQQAALLKAQQDAALKAQVAARQGYRQLIDGYANAGMDKMDEAARIEQRVGDINAQAADDIYKKRLDNDAALASLEGQIKANEETRKAKADAMAAKVNQDIEDLKNKRIDPNRYFADRGMGSVIMTGLAMGLGSFGSTLTKSPNVIADFVNRQIAADIDAQKMEADNAKDAAVLRGNLYHTMLGQYKDERLADQAARLAAVDLAQNQLQTLAAKYNSPLAKEQANKIVNELQAKKLQYQEGISKQLYMLDHPEFAAIGNASKGGSSGSIEKEKIEPAVMKDLGGYDSILGALDDAEAKFNTGEYGIPTALDKTRVENANWLPGFLAPDQKVTGGYQAFQSIKAQMLKAVSGATVTEQEAQRWEAILGGANDMESLRRGFALVRSEIATRKNSALSGLSENQYKAYLARTGGRGTNYAASQPNKPAPIPGAKKQ